MNDNYDERDDELLAMASRLSTEVAPQRDLWPGIDAAIAPPQRARWSPRFAQAAAAVLLVAGSSGVTYMTVTDKYESDQPVLTQPVLPNMLFEETSFGGKYTLGSGFQDARGPFSTHLRKPNGKKRLLATQSQLHGLRNGPALIDRNRSIAERCQDPLARQPFRVAEGFHQLKHRGSPNRLCPEKHAQIIASAPA